MSPATSELPTPWWRRVGPRGTFWCARFAFLRVLGLVYLVAFAGMAVDGAGLIGEHGLLPAGPWMDGVLADLGSPSEAMRRAPSLFWLTGISDPLLSFVCGLGAVLAAVVLLGYANVPVMAALWALYFSLVSVGQRWFHFGWESQLLETGLLACFLVPLTDGRPFRARPSRAAIVLGWWLVARLMLGAGLIKLRGSPCWTELTCLDVHFETQPIPGPLSRSFHLLPGPLLAGGVLFNHVAELVAPCLIWGPRRLRHLAAATMVVFQVTLILSGNLSFLNWLTLAPLMLLFDDQLLAPRRAAVWEGLAGGEAPSIGEGLAGGEAPNEGEGRAGGEAPNVGEGLAGGEAPNGGEGLAGGEAPNVGEGLAGGEAPNGGEGLARGEAPNVGERLAGGEAPSGGEGLAGGEAPTGGEAPLLAARLWAHRRSWPVAVYAAVVIWLSVPVVANLLSPDQSMNRSFGALRIVNTYGAFGSVGAQRWEIAIEGTADDPQHPEPTWHEYAFRCKPGPIDRRPCWITPWHLRLDWLAWFAGLEAARGQGLRREAWVAHLVHKLLIAEPAALDLLAADGVPADFRTTPPRAVRVRLFRYEYAPPGDGWWHREEAGLVFPPLTRDDPRLLSFLKERGWR